MRKRPLLFFTTSLILIGIALSFPLQIAWLYQHGLGEVKFIIEKLTIFNWVCMLALTTLAVQALDGSRWMYLGIPITFGLITWNNLLVGYWGYDYSLMTTTFSTLGFAFFCLFPFLPQYAMVIQDPSKRWWLVATRKEIMIPVYISPFRGHQFQSKTLDISRTGAFIESSDAEVCLGDMVDLNLKIDTIQSLNLKAEVVRLPEDKDGFGVRFHELEQSQKKTLNRYLQTH